MVKTFVHLSLTLQFNATPQIHSPHPKGPVISGSGNNNFS